MLLPFRILGFEALDEILNLDGQLEIPHSLA